MTILIEGLTEDQNKAVAKLKEDQKKKFFRGISYEFLITDFRTVNTLRQTNLEKATSNEKALFALCGYDPSN
jgi:hypothetical protein